MQPEAQKMTTEVQQNAQLKPVSPWKVIGLIILTVVLSVGITLSAVYLAIFPMEFKPVTLNQKEEQVLEQKLQRLDPTARRSTNDEQATLTPEPYSEEGASREIALTEKELNALLAKNTDLAHRLVIDLSEDLASAKLLVPLDPELPLLGGKTLKLTAGAEVRITEGRPVVILKGVSLWGVPMPNAWLGNNKNIDLIQEYGDRGFWKAFAEGVEEIEVKEGKLRIKLKE
ncbi:MAG: arginine N-succinyltransferase [Gammaproteobacteria bacterium]|nr:arginine N-succinyltransferase [Gammaproteobacteria bacterium]MCW8992738.1 arginine N-succinyltransferase [Gammaproteobacteria bacterium]